VVAFGEQECTGQRAECSRFGGERRCAGVSALQACGGAGEQRGDRLGQFSRRRHHPSVSCGRPADAPLVHGGAGDEDGGGWVTLYSYQDIERGKNRQAMVVRAARPAERQARGLGQLLHAPREKASQRGDTLGAGGPLSVRVRLRGREG
jgi:hypothetical protein